MSLKVEDVMVEDVISVSEKATVREAAELMNRHEIGCLVVAKKGKPIGIVTETDMVKRVILKSVDPEKTRVSEIMSKPLVVGNPQMNVDEASKIMRRQKIKKLPVVEKGRLVGLVTTTDIVRSPEVMKMMIRAIKRNVIKEIIYNVYSGEAGTRGVVEKGSTRNVVQISRFYGILSRGQTYTFYNG